MSVAAIMLLLLLTPDRCQRLVPLLRLPLDDLLQLSADLRRRLLRLALDPDFAGAHGRAAPDAHQEVLVHRAELGNVVARELDEVDGLEGRDARLGETGAGGLDAEFAEKEEHWIEGIVPAPTYRFLLLHKSIVSLIDLLVIQISGFAFREETNQRMIVCG
jgi:hypothetical protein